MSATRPVLITPTWAGDLDHFRLMRASVRESPLRDLEHQVIVQTEDLPLFEAFRNEPNLVLRSTADVLPAPVERRRRQARWMSRHLGRHLVRISGSLRRKLGWPRWPGYTGWHTQQLCKLMVAAERAAPTAIVLDSDVIVTRSADPALFEREQGLVCLAQWTPYADLKGKVRNWVTGAAALHDTALQADSRVNTYFDTPFVLDGPMLKAMFADLERHHGRRWWQVLLNQPPRRWSEFGIYKQYLLIQTERPVEWKAPDFTRYIYDTSDEARLIEEVTGLLDDPAIQFITIHSQSAGKQNWDASGYTARLRQLVERP